MMYVLDTDHFTLAHHSKHGLRERIETEQSTNEVVLSIVTRIEVLRGRFEAVLKAADSTELKRALHLLSSSEAFMAEFPIVGFDEAALRQFDRLRNDKKARKAGRDDLLIACIALANGATLVTRNTKDFANISGLKLENWAN